MSDSPVKKWKEHHKIKDNFFTARMLLPSHSFSLPADSNKERKEREYVGWMKKGMDGEKNSMEKTLTSFSFVEISELEVKGLKFFSFFFFLIYTRATEKTL